MKCPECGFGYDPKLQSNRKRHRTFHDEVLHGIPDPGTTIPTEEVVWREELEKEPFFTNENGDLCGGGSAFAFALSDRVLRDRIIAVTPSSPHKERVLGRRVARLANRELGYLFGIFNEHEDYTGLNLHIFLYITDGRIIGLAKFVLATDAVSSTWEDYEQKRGKKYETVDPTWTIGAIWVHKEYRRRGIATTLISAGTKYLGSSLDEIGVCPPLSENGLALARNLFPDVVRFVE